MMMIWVLLALVSGGSHLNAQFQDSRSATTERCRVVRPSCFTWHSHVFLPIYLTNLWYVGKQKTRTSFLLEKIPFISTNVTVLNLWNILPVIYYLISSNQTIKHSWNGTRLPNGLNEEKKNSSFCCILSQLPFKQQQVNEIKKQKLSYITLKRTSGWMFAKHSMPCHSFTSRSFFSS